MPVLSVHRWPSYCRCFSIPSPNLTEPVVCQYGRLLDYFIMYGCFGSMQETNAEALHEFLSRHRLAEDQPLSTHVV